VQLVIDLDPESGQRSIGAIHNGKMPVVIHDSVLQWLNHLVVLREVYNGKDVDSLFWSEAA